MSTAQSLTLPSKLPDWQAGEATLEELVARSAADRFRKYGFWNIPNRRVTADLRRRAVALAGG